MQSHLFELAGASFRPSYVQTFIPSLEVGTKLFLDREPTNQYDPNAVKVLLEYGDEPLFLGYVPKDNASMIAPVLDAGNHEVDCKIVGKQGKKPMIELILIEKDEQ